MSEHAPRHEQPYGAAPWPQDGPTVQQFQQAGGGYVLPGAPSGQAPLASNHGYIGLAPAQAQQAWGFPTPQGLQLVQHGAAPAHLPHSPQHGGAQHQTWLQPVTNAGATTASGVAVAPQRMGRRVRWETIVPAVAIMCFVAAVGVFIADFDSITGRTPTSPASVTGNGPSRAAADTAPAVATPAATQATAKQLLREARAYLRQGNFEEAATTLDPLLTADRPLPAVSRLSMQIAAASKRNSALLTQLVHQQTDRQWQGVIATIGKLRQLRPLSPQLNADLRQARAKLLLAKTNAATKANAGPSTARSQRAPATPAEPVASGSNAPPTSRPPASGPTGSLPPRPPKPAVAGGGAPANGTPAPPGTNPSMPDMVM